MVCVFHLRIFLFVLNKMRDFQWQNASLFIQETVTHITRRVCQLINYYLNKRLYGAVYPVFKYLGRNAILCFAFGLITTRAEFYKLLREYVFINFKHEYIRGVNHLLLEKV